MKNIQNILSEGYIIIEVIHMTSGIKEGNSKLTLAIQNVFSKGYKITQQAESTEEAIEQLKSLINEINDIEKEKVLNIEEFRDIDKQGIAYALEQINKLEQIIAA